VKHQTVTAKFPTGRRPYRGLCACGEHAWAILTRGSVTMVSPEDAPVLRGAEWHVTFKEVRRQRRPYATRARGRRKIRLHRQILDVPKGTLTDHVDRNTLNNRRGNLRPCSHSENNGNSHHPLGASGFRGVYEEPSNDVAAVARFGEFATTNESLGLLAGERKRHREVSP
jgi:hypothetical protein